MCSLKYTKYSNLVSSFRCFTTKTSEHESQIILNGLKYNKDSFTNVTPKILNHVGINLVNREYHPLNYLKKRIVDYFYSSFKGRTGNPVFSVYDNLFPVVSIEQNFQSLLVPEDHPSRKKTDSYYLNRDYMLRAHMTAHQSEMIKSGLDNFLVFGDVYRRDEIDSTHYPVFHQCDAVRLCSRDHLENIAKTDIEIFENGEENQYKQSFHTLDASKIMEGQLKNTLFSLAQELFGKGTKCRWVDVYFPFTHPSWELEVNFEGKWMEVLGCGIMRHEILQKNGAEGRIGWAFGLGLERIAMCLYKIPDIRLFWSQDSGFTSQFEGKPYNSNIKYKPVSAFPQCTNDISFWLPDDYDPNDFYELVRDIGGELIEQVTLVDNFKHPKTGKRSHCYRITYRHLERTLKKDEVNIIHQDIEEKSQQLLGVKVR